MSMLKYWLWLSAAPVSSKAKGALLRRYGDAETAYFAPEGEFRSLEGVSAAEAGVLEDRDMSRVRRIVNECRAQKISIVTMQDALYPQRLKNIYDPPAVLYVKGQMPAVDDNALIAVIGTRKASPYGLKMAGRLSYGITKCGGIVVSGLTAGIDAEAAKAALMAGGICIGVLGTAHEENRSPLARDVAQAGALISEYPPGTIAQKSFFRARNRISAGLSVGTVVVEAPKGSGALLFAREALEQGKGIFAVPGNADSANSAGTIELLKDGAKPVTEAWDVIGELSSIFPESLHPAEEEAMPAERENPPLSPARPVKADGKENIDLRAQLAGLNEQQLSIVTAIDSTGRHIDDIIEETALTSQQVMGSITMLEIKGIVRRLPGNRIALNIAKK